MALGENAQVSPNTDTPYKVLVIGGSYAGLAAALNLLDLCNSRPCRFTGETETFAPRPRIPVKITIVDERDGFYHLIGNPLAFASEEYASKIWIRFDGIPALQTSQIKWIQGSAATVDCGKKSCLIREAATQSQIEESYDFLVAGSGLRRNWPTVPRSLNKVEYDEEVANHVEKVRHSRNGIVVIGGGAVGVEMAAELKLALPTQKVTLVHSQQRLLSSEQLPDEMKDCVLTALHGEGVETVLGSRVSHISQPSEKDGHSTITLSDGRQIEAGHVIDAISRSCPTSHYLPGDTLDKEGYVKINARLNFSGDVPNADSHYAAGDIALWPGIKRAGSAMHQGHHAALNIHQTMLAEKLGAIPNYVEIQKPPPLICVAIGRNAVGYNPMEGVISGEDMLKLYFRDDLGFEICWNYLRLGEAATN